MSPFSRFRMSCGPEEEIEVSGRFRNTIQGYIDYSHFRNNHQCFRWMVSAAARQPPRRPGLPCGPFVVRYPPPSRRVKSAATHHSGPARLKWRKSRASCPGGPRWHGIARQPADAGRGANDAHPGGGVFPPPGPWSAEAHGGGRTVRRRSAARLRSRDPAGCHGADLRHGPGARVGALPHGGGRHADHRKGGRRPDSHDGPERPAVLRDTPPDQSYPA